MESRIDAFEAARRRDPRTSLSLYLPDSSDAAYLTLLGELLRVDLEYAWESGARNVLGRYAAEYPEYFADPERVSSLAFEEYRLRWQAGESVSREEYRDQWGIVTDHWPALPEADSTVRQLDHGSTQRGPGLAGDVPDGKRSLLAADFPQVGEMFEGFEILEELGRGAVGRVFRARQRDLANRTVVLKLSTEMWHESDRIARLQHTNIVPLYSVHRAGRFQAICMPFFGRTVLAGRMRQMRGVNPAVRTASDLLGPPASGNNLPKTEVAAGRDRPASYTAACLRLVQRLAEALDHAHCRGIWHHDIKPANVLLADNGEPMLLDFNLASRSTDRHVLVAGGTVPYMAPEQIQGLRQPVRLGAGCDVFGLGVILYELLTGKLPYEATNAWDEATLESALEQRARVPAAGLSNPSLTPAVDAILRRCLAPDAADRYQSAAELAEDVRRQLTDLPLRHAPDRSWSERAAKWSRRHPRIMSATTMAMVAASLMAVLSVSWWWRGRQVQAFEAEARLGRLEDALVDLRTPITTQNDLAGVDLHEPARILDEWQQSSAAFPSLDVMRQALPPARRRALDSALGELLYWNAEAVVRQAVLDRPLREVSAEIAQARQLNDRAARRFTGGEVPQWVKLQARRLSQMEQGLPPDDWAPAMGESGSGNNDAAMEAIEAMRHAAYVNALERLESARQQAPRDFNLWLLAGNCHRALDDLRQAELDFTAAAALSPDSFRPYLHRGLARLEAAEFEAAEQDFSRVLELRPELPEGYLNRAVARMRLERYREALEDLDRVLALGDPPTRLYFFRARLHRLLGNEPTALQDHQLGIQRRPTDEKSWIARGVARLPVDARGALSDFQRALEINPWSISALQNMAHVYGEYLDDPEAAIEALDVLLRIRPDDATALAGRGVFQARLGRRALALKDAQQAMVVDQTPQTLYQVACVYALTSAVHADDVPRAIGYLARAGLAEAKWFELAPSDPDLKNLVEQPAFSQLLAAARFVRGSALAAER